MSREFARGVSLTFITRISGVAIGIVTLTVTTRLLGPEGRGVFAVCMAAIALLLQLTNLGLHAAATYWLAHAPERRQDVADLLVWFCAGPVAAAALAAIGLALIFPAVIPDVPLRTFTLAMASAPPAMFLLLASNAALGLRLTNAFNTIDLATKIIGLAAVLVLFCGSLNGVFTGYAVLHAIAAVAVYGWFAGLRRPRRPSPAIVRDMVGYGTRIFVVGLSMFLVLRLDIFLVNGMLSTADAGRYSVAVQVGEVLSLASASISAILFPTLSAMAAERRWPATRRVLRVTGALLAAGAVAVGAVAKPLFHLWFGPAYDPAVIALWWLLPGLWCLGMNSLLHQHLAAFQMPWFLAWSTAGGASVNAIANVVLLPRFGIGGAALASTITYAGLLCATVLFLGSPHGRRYLA
jgi:O-antigen/teichoic acid export membrane protein